MEGHVEGVFMMHRELNASHNMFQEPAPPQRNDAASGKQRTGQPIRRLQFKIMTLPDDADTNMAVPGCGKDAIGISASTLKVSPKKGRCGK